MSSATCEGRFANKTRRRAPESRHSCLGQQVAQGQGKRGEEPGVLLVVAWAAVGDEEQREVLQQLWLGRDWTKSQKRPHEIMASRHLGMP